MRSVLIALAALAALGAGPNAVVAKTLTIRFEPPHEKEPVEILVKWIPGSSLSVEGIDIEYRGSRNGKERKAKGAFGPEVRARVAELLGPRMEDLSAWPTEHGCGMKPVWRLSFAGGAELRRHSHNDARVVCHDSKATKRLREFLAFATALF